MVLLSAQVLCPRLVKHIQDNIGYKRSSTLFVFLSPIHTDIFYCNLDFLGMRKYKIQTKADNITHFFFCNVKSK